MKTIIRNFGIGMNSIQRQTAKQQMADLLKSRGTGNKPQPPRDLYVQSGSRGILLNWRAPANATLDTAGFRIYKDNENSLFAEIRDPGTTQHYIEATSGTTPPLTNLFVSTVNQLGAESPKVQIQGTATAETGAPSIPSTPPTFTINYSKAIVPHGFQSL